MSLAGNNASEAGGYLAENSTESNGEGDWQDNIEGESGNSEDGQSNNEWTEDSPRNGLGRRNQRDDDENDQQGDEINLDSDDFVA